MNLKGANVLVTGAASGMGLATASHLSHLGATVFGLDLQKGSIEMAANLFHGKALVADVSDAESVNKALSKIDDLHVVVHCAGIVDGARVVGKEGPQSLDRFEKVIQVNLIGTFNVIRLAAAKMSVQKPIHEDERGVIITTASVAAFDGQIGQAAYSASKGGVAAMTLPVARELGQFGIRIMTIAPGIMETPMMAGMTDKVTESLRTQLVYPKRLGKPDEFALLVQHIIENPYLNGETIRLDAGIRLAAK